MSSGSVESNNKPAVAHDLRYMVGDGNQGPQLGKGNKPAPSSAKGPLGNFEKMITTTLRKSPERLLEDGEFSKTVRKGTQEIIQALHKTNKTQVMKQRVEQFARCETLLRQLDNKFTALINSTPSKNLKRREEIKQIAEIVTTLLLQLKKEAVFVDQVKKSFVAVPAPDSLNERIEPAEVPTNIVGMMASFLPEKEAEAVLDPLLEQFAKKSERVAAKLAASKEAAKGEKWAKEVSIQIRKALKRQRENFVFPEELKRATKEVTSLDLSSLGSSLSVKAMKEILANWPNITDLNLAENRMTQEMVDLLKEFKDLRYLNLESTHIDDKMLVAVAKCTTLQSLNCSTCNGITSLEPLKSCPLLQSLDCSLCQRITSLEPLKSCPLLQILNCGCTRIISLKPLESCPLLQILDCAACSEITSLKPLESCPLLQNLNCNWCKKITSLESLKSCPLLQSLDCRRCNITSLESLASCPLLQRLVCIDCNEITSLEPLKSCPLLQSLYCADCVEITSLEPLISCLLLQLLDCRECPGISPQERAALKHVLPALIIYD